MEEIRHEPLAYFSGKFNGWQLQGVAMDKQAVVVVRGYRRGECMLCEKDISLSFHRNSEYVICHHGAGG